MQSTAEKRGKHRKGILPGGQEKQNIEEPNQDSIHRHQILKTSFFEPFIINIANAFFLVLFFSSFFSIF